MPGKVEIPPPPVPSAVERRSLSVFAWRVLVEHCAGQPALTDDPVQGIGPIARPWPPPGAAWRDAVVELPSDGGLLARQIGVFVTLYRKDALRGCLGSAHARDPLWRAVVALTRKAAAEDPRFPPVDAPELPDLRIEITCLGSAVRLPSSPDWLLEHLEPGLHGVWLRWQGKSGLFLPQVARRYGWSAAVLLEQVALKAGLERDAWRQAGAEVLAFTATSFEAPRPSPEPGGGKSGGE